MNQHAQAISQIIRHQQLIIGPLAINQAKKVTGLQIASLDNINISGNGKDVLGRLVDQYAQLFGKASVEVCKDAVKEIKPPLPPEDLPDVLK